MKRIISCSILLVLLTALVSAQQSYTLSPNSKLTISGTSTVHDWIVTANRIDGSLQADKASPVAIDFQVEVAEIKSERGATMDKKMHAALQMEKHPTVKFKLMELKGESSLLGPLTIAGKSQNVAIDSKITSTEDAFQFTGEFKLVLADFDIEPPTAMFGQVIVGDDVTIHFDLIFESVE